MLAMFAMVDLTRIQHKNLNHLEAAIYWFASPKRVAFHVLSRTVRALFRPLIHVAFGILVKRALGLNSEHSASTSQIVLLRRYINSFLLSREELKEAFLILGTHYEMVSVSSIPGIAGKLMTRSQRLFIGRWALKLDNVSTGQVPEYIVPTPNYWRLGTTLFLVLGLFLSLRTHREVEK
jgi:hypothetical protein